MTSTSITPTPPLTRRALSQQAVVASYKSHADAEGAVGRLAICGFPMALISIIGRNFETHRDIQRFYRPADAVREGADEGAWFGGASGLMLGAMGFFVLPVVGGLMIIGPLAGLVAGASGGAGVGVLVDGLITLGIPRDHALEYQERLKAGEFLVVVHGNVLETDQAREILHGTPHTHLAKHMAMRGDLGTSAPDESQCESCKRQGLNLTNAACLGRRLAQPPADASAEEARVDRFAAQACG